MEKFLYAKFEDNVIPSELEVFEFTRTDGAMVLTGQSKLRFIGSITDTPPPVFKPLEMPAIAAAIAPIVAPNPAPGKEVLAVDLIGSAITAPPNRKSGFTAPTEEQLEARRILAKMDPTILANAAGESDDVVGAAEAEPETDNATLITHHADGTDTIVHEPAPKRKRRAKAAAETPAEPVGEPTDFKLSEAAAPEPAQLPIPEAAYTPVVEKGPIIGLPTAEELKSFRSRLFNMTSEVLPKGGMVPTEGVGGINAKVRLFVATMFPGVTDMKYLTKEQWEEFLAFLEGFAREHNGTDLVAYIHEKIGVKE